MKAARSLRVSMARGTPIFPPFSHAQREWGIVFKKATLAFAEQRRWIRDESDRLI